ncbi:MULTISPECIES: ABC transporter ATP-binding protein [unclassified Aeromicrobium]|uniref:ABC transporter ATP-binding protein n=1 Tax=unclassified Aeromicrobium TaxID=2633570 RepID=UPI00396B481D
MSVDASTSTAGGAEVVIDSYTKAYGDRVILSDLDLRVRPGEFVVVVGKSGCGKSTLLRALAGLDTEFSGTVVAEGTRSFGFQDARLLPWAKVWSNVALGVSGRAADLRERAGAALAEVGLEDRLDAWPSTLSGGEQQRVALARALFREPALLLLDEPFGALDALTRIRAQALVQRLWRAHGFTAVLVTHDVEEAIVLADRVVVLADGGVKDVLTIDLPRPRPHRDPRFGEYRNRILHELGVDDEEVVA